MQQGSRQGNSIDAREVSRALESTVLAGSVHHLAQVASTNDLALQAAQSGALHGVWVADEQTAGRGRGGHNWLSVPGSGLYVSALFSPRLPASALQLSLAAGLAAWEAVREVTGIVADLRWPNDLVNRDEGGHGSRKLGGVLVETAVTPAKDRHPAQLRYAVIGIGLNVAHTSFPRELAAEATSLLLEGWQQPDRQPLLIALLLRLCAHVRHLEEAGAGRSAQPSLFERLQQASTWLHGKAVHVPEEGGYTGLTAGVDREGFLLVEGKDGRRHTVRSGGVRALAPAERSHPHLG